MSKCPKVKKRERRVAGKSAVRMQRRTDFCIMIKNYQYAFSIESYLGTTTRNRYRKRVTSPYQHELKAPKFDHSKILQS